MRPVLTINEFRSAYRAADWRMSRHFVFFFGAALLYLAAPIWSYGIIFGKLRDDHMDWVIHRFGTFWPFVFIVAYSIPAFILALLSVRKIDRHILDNPRLRCPNCNASLLGLPLTIATGKCGGCGQQVIEPNVVPSDVDSMHQYPTIDEFNQQCQRLSNQMIFRIIMAGFLGAIAFVIGGLTYGWMGYGPNSPMLALFFTPALAVLIGVIWTTDRLDRDSLVTRCRFCRQSLMYCRPVVVATRNCGHCGRRLLADPEAHSPNIQP